MNCIKFMKKSYNEDFEFILLFLEKVWGMKKIVRNKNNYILVCVNFDICKYIFESCDEKVGKLYYIYDMFLKNNERYWM